MFPPLPPFQSPSLRGSGRFPPLPPLPSLPEIPVSIPFIAGQWSLLVYPAAFKSVTTFQSPSLRGSGRFKFGLGPGRW